MNEDKGEQNPLSTKVQFVSKVHLPRTNTVAGSMRRLTTHSFIIVENVPFFDFQ